MFSKVRNSYLLEKVKWFTKDQFMVSCILKDLVILGCDPTGFAFEETMHKWCRYMLGLITFTLTEPLMNVDFLSMMDLCFRKFSI